MLAAASPAVEVVEVVVTAPVSEPGVVAAFAELGGVCEKVGAEIEAET